MSTKIETVEIVARGFACVPATAAGEFQAVMRDSPSLQVFGTEQSPPQDRQKTPTSLHPVPSEQVPAGQSNPSGQPPSL